MIGFGAIVKSIGRALEQASDGLRLALRGRRPKPSLVPIPVRARRLRRWVSWKAGSDD